MQGRLKTRPCPLAKSIRFRAFEFLHQESHVFTHPALPNDFPAVVGNDALDLVELVRFDD
jgi:hypothetical protein